MIFRKLSPEAVKRDTSGLFFVPKMQKIVPND